MKLQHKFKLNVVKEESFVNSFYKLNNLKKPFQSSVVKEERFSNLFGNLIKLEQKLKSNVVKKINLQIYLASLTTLINHLN